MAVAPLAQQLGLTPEKGAFCRVRNLRDQTERLWPTRQLQDGLELSLEGYQYEVFHNFELLQDPTGKWGKLYEMLGGKPVLDLDLALLRSFYQDEWHTFQILFAPERLLALGGMLLETPLVAPGKVIMQSLEEELRTLFTQLTGQLDLPQSACRACRRW